jgi:hypothetical protein
MEEIAMLEERMKETMEPANFFIEISATPDTQKPTIIIGPAADNSAQSEATKHQNLKQLTEALVKSGADRRTVENDLKRIYAPIEGDPMAGESACYTLSLTIAQARDFGWQD